MYLSKINLLNSSQAKATLLTLSEKGVYASHQLLWRLFSSSTEREFLFREEQSPQGLPVFFLLSRKPPDDLPQLFDIQTKLFEPQLKEGTRLAYKLRVNPTISKKSDDGRSHRHDVLMNAKRTASENGIVDSTLIREQMDLAAQGWFAEDSRLQRWGFQLDMLPDIESYVQHQATRKKEHAIQFSSVDLQGMLTVREPERFLNQLALGFGRSKSFGCGLMLIRRI